jgi:hypothetical protein
MHQKIIIQNVDLSYPIEFQFAATIHVFIMNSEWINFCTIVCWSYSENNCD